MNWACSAPKANETPRKFHPDLALGFQLVARRGQAIYFTHAANLLGSKQ